jgi:hypothetical protein
LRELLRREPFFQEGESFVFGVSRTDRIVRGRGVYAGLHSRKVITVPARLDLRGRHGGAEAIAAAVEQ